MAGRAPRRLSRRGFRSRFERPARPTRSGPLRFEGAVIYGPESACERHRSVTRRNWHTKLVSMCSRLVAPGPPTRRISMAVPELVKKLTNEHRTLDAAIADERR